MKILITGLPKSGKSTLLKKVVDKIPDKIGFYAQEITENGARTGFEAVSNNGHRTTLASTNIKSKINVSRYGVDIEGFESFLKNLPEPKTSQVIYIDEIGQMQLYSSDFKELVSIWLKLNNTFIGTISKIYNDEFTDSLRNRSGIAFIELTQDNRTHISNALVSLASNIAFLDKLNPQQSNLLTQLVNKYSENNSYIQLAKLFNNSLIYLNRNRIDQISANEYSVKGNTNDHIVTINDNKQPTCDCNLFNGAGEYENRAGECSHIQSVLLYKEK